MSKRKPTSEEAVANILRCFEADDDRTKIILKVIVKLNLVWQEMMMIEMLLLKIVVMMMRMRLKIKVLLTMTSLSLNLNRAIDRHEKCWHIIVWSTQSTNRLTQIVLIHMILALLMMKNMKQSWQAIWVQRKILRRKQFYGQTKSRKESVDKEAAIFCHEVLNRQRYYHLHLELKAWEIPFMSCSQMKWLN